MLKCWKQSTFCSISHSKSQIVNSQIEGVVGIFSMQLLVIFTPVLIIKLLLQLFLQTNFGDIEFGFFPHVAPKTVAHIFKLVRLGCYNTNHIFRVFRLQIASFFTLHQHNLIFFINCLFNYIMFMLPFPGRQGLCGTSCCCCRRQNRPNE